MKELKTIALATLLLLSTEVSGAKEPVKTAVVKGGVVQKTNLKNSIVKIFTVSNEADNAEPWSSHVNQFTGSGCIINGNRILTNAHVVTNATYVEVLKNGENKRYEATVLYIDHEADLAVITLKDESFFKDTKSLELGELPELQKEVSVYGFPMGGDTLSITKGVVSRVEQQRYANSGRSLLAIQIDAAINYGNSGGPAISDGKMVGLVMQGASYGENMGYIIPPSVIKHFFKDIQDEKYNGYADLGMTTQSLESPVLKEMYGLKDKCYGILVNETIPNSPSSAVFKTGDILIAVEGHEIYSNGKIELREKEFVAFEYIVHQHQMGESVEFTILRDKKEKKVSMKLDKKHNAFSLIKKRQPESVLSYFIYGGLVFVPVTNNYYYGVPSKFYDLYPNEEREELVMMQRILSSSLTQGLGRQRSTVIETVNGKKFKNFKSFVKLLEESQEEFILLEDSEHQQMALNRKEVLKNQKIILERYNIAHAKSKDLREAKTMIKLAKK